MTDLTYGDLPNSLTEPQTQMTCTECNEGPWSAHRDDYWYAPDNEPVICQCGAPMQLGTTRTYWQPRRRTS